VWLFIAAFTIDHSATATTNDVVLGIIVFVLALISGGATPLRGGASPASRA
jgi:hypothetical protein